MAKQVKFVFLLMFGTILIFVAQALTELPIILFVRRSGRYDPNQIWEGPQSVLVGVNDCQQDEMKDITEHIWKGDFRNPVIDTLDKYELFDVEVVLYNNQDNELYRIKNCSLDDWNCRDKDGEFKLQTLDKQGGLVARSTQRKTFIIFNPRHYFSDSNIFDGQKIVIRVQNDNAFPPTGYFGCYSLPAGQQSDTNDPMSVDVCFNKCTSDYFGIQTNKCFCNLNKADLQELNETACKHLCCNDNNHFCGIENETSIAVYKKDELSAFKTFVKSLSNAATRIGQMVTMSENYTSHRVDFVEMMYLSSILITEEEECMLTNIALNITEEQMARYRLRYTINCSQPEDLWDVFDDEQWGTNEFLHAKTTQLPLGLLKVKCLLIEAIESNYTFARANVTFYGPNGDFAEVAGIAIRANYTEILESTSISSMIESSLESSFAATESVSMEMTSQLDSTVLSDMTVVETTMVETSSVETSMTSTLSHDTFTTVMTTSSAAVPLPTDETPTPSKTEACMCRCKTEDLAKTQNKTMEEVKDEKVAKIKKELYVDTKDLAATKMKKESAKDVRTSAQVGGYVGIILLVLVVGMMLLADITSIFQHMANMKQK